MVGKIDEGCTGYEWDRVTVWNLACNVSTWRAVREALQNMVNGASFIR
jgi:hypothetical protein